jgi:hypothetical protein
VQAADEADPAEKEPAGQSPLIKPEAAQYLPAGQGMHATDEVAPPEENDPAGHVKGPEAMPTEAPVSVEV